MKGFNFFYIYPYEEKKKSMDQQLLRALEDIGQGLEELTNAIKNKEEAQSPTAEAIQSADFTNQLETITDQLRDIKSDTKEILNRQRTIESIVKQKQDEEKTEGLAIGDQQKEKIKQGVGTILLIAGAVIAIGRAFNIAGDVDPSSVIALSLSLTIISLAFVKIAELGISLETAAITSASLVMMSMAITAASWAFSMAANIGMEKMLSISFTGLAIGLLMDPISKIIPSLNNIGYKNALLGAGLMLLVLPSIALAISLSSHVLSTIEPISVSSGLSAILIAGVFSVIGFSIKNIIEAFSEFNIKDLLGVTAVMIVVLPAISLAIALSSHILPMTQMLSLESFIGAIMVSSLFVAIAFGVKLLMNSFEDINPAQAMAFSITVPILMITMSMAITYSSKYLSSIEMISWPQFFTAVGIALTFIPIAFAVGVLLKMTKNIDFSDTLKLPLFFTTMSIAIALSSQILQNTADLSGQLQNIFWTGLTIAALGVVFGGALWVISKLGISNMVKGGAATIIISGVVMAVSHILNKGIYENYPSIDWVLGAGASILAFGLSSMALGLMVSGPQAIIFAAGLAATLPVAMTIVAVSEILNKGDYSSYPPIEWASSVSLLYATFTPLLLVLGSIGLASKVAKFFGTDPFKTAQTMILDIAQTIVSTSFILNKGSYQGGPTKEWAKGIALSLGGFAPVYKMLSSSGIFESEVKPEEFSDGIKTISLGITTAAAYFADADGDFKSGPSKEWSEGVGIAISAFAPVYSALMSGGFFKQTYSPEDMSQGIETITGGIVTAARILEKNKATFDGGYPEKEWGEGVGSAIEAFSPVFDILSEKKFLKSSKKELEDLVNGISMITTSMVESAKAIENQDWGNYPNKNWVNNTGYTLSKYIEIIKEIDDKNLKNRTIRNYREVLDEVVRTASKIQDNSEGFKLSIPEGFISTIRKNLTGFIGLSSDLNQILEDNEDIINKPYHVSNEVIKIAEMLYNSKEWFKGSGLYQDFYDNVVKYDMMGIENSGIIYQFAKLSQMLGFNWETYDYFHKVEDITRNLVSVSGILKENEKLFNVDINPDYMKNVSKNILDFNSLVKQLKEDENESGKSLPASDMDDNTVHRIADRMVTLAEGYDVLADSIVKLNNAMNSLDVSNLPGFNLITNHIIQKSENSDTGKLLYSPDEKEGENLSSLNMGNIKPANQTTPNQYSDQKLDKIIDLLTSIDKSTLSVDDVLEELLDESSKKKEEDSAWWH